VVKVEVLLLVSVEVEILVLVSVEVEVLVLVSVEVSSSLSSLAVNLEAERRADANKEKETEQW